MAPRSPGFDSWRVNLRKVDSACENYGITSWSNDGRLKRSVGHAVFIECRVRHTQTIYPDPPWLKKKPYYSPD